MSERVTCGVEYYPPWSSRGIRAVRCTRPARFTVVDPPSWSADHVCGIHANVVRNHGGITLLDGIYWSAEPQTGLDPQQRTWRSAQREG